MKKVLIVGAGLSGSYIARQLADLGCKVEIVEQRATVGGNLYDEVDTLTGCTVHKYGPHIFIHQTLSYGSLLISLLSLILLS